MDSLPLKVGGVPALFIPGNAGSYKQSRSSASIAMRMHQAEFTSKQNFDFFTVNLNEVSVQLRSSLAGWLVTGIYLLGFLLLILIVQWYRASLRVA